MQGNLHNSKLFAKRETSGRFSGILYTTIIYIYSLVFLRYMLQPIRIRLTTLSCFETNIYLRVSLGSHACKPVSDPQTKIFCK